jgi:hypothetical protein
MLASKEMHMAVLCETSLERASRRVLEAERRITAQINWINQLSYMNYDTADDEAKLTAMREDLQGACAEHSRQQALTS